MKLHSKCFPFVSNQLLLADCASSCSLSRTQMPAHDHKRQSPRDGDVEFVLEQHSPSRDDGLLHNFRGPIFTLWRPGTSCSNRFGSFFRRGFHPEADFDRFYALFRGLFDQKSCCWYALTFFFASTAAGWRMKNMNE